MMENKNLIISEIKSFLDGSDNENKYLVNVETNSDNNIAFCIFHPPKQDIIVKEIRYTPFMYIKDFKKHGIKLYGGDTGLLKAKMIEYGITIKKLKTGDQPRLVDGFSYMVTSTKSFNAIGQFFRNGGIDPYQKKMGSNGKPLKINDRYEYIHRHLFYNVKPTEQFFISTGIRMFKGFEDYSDVHRLTFDIETTGLRYEITRIFAIGVRDNRGFETVLKVSEPDNDDAERKLIQDFFNTIDYIKPAIIQGYNSEAFDFEFILGRAGILNMEISKLKTTFDSSHIIKRIPNSSVKFGNSSEKYTATQMWGYSVIDILHAVKKTAAINTDIKQKGLKYICKLEGIAKENRMYIDGSDGNIGKYWHENKIFIINPVNNEYLQIPEEFQENGKLLYLLQHNKDSKKIDDNYFKLKKYEILNSNREFYLWLVSKVEKYGIYRFITGKQILNRYLLDDLWETEAVDNLYNQSTFLLSKIIPTNYSRVATMGNAAVWNLLMTTWSYENGLAIPDNDISENFGGGLVRCYKRGYYKRVVKIDFASLYPMIQLTWDVFPMFDITGVIKKMLIYMTTTRNIYKKLANSDDISDDEIMLLKELDHDTYDKYITNTILDSERAKFKVKQLPIKIINNSLFGALGSGIAFNWSDNICAARITSIGRIQLRKAINYFTKYGLVPLLAVTDGVNFGIPDKTNIKIDNHGVTETETEGTIEEMWTYNDKVGVAAIIEKFNSEEMPIYQSVDNDGEFISCYNLSRINYALLTEKKDKKSGELIRKVKLTGNTIKSKVMPEYIEDFINKGFQLIMDGKGKEFVDYYYDYSEDIYYNRIPLKKIASKKKIKMSLNDYKNRGTDKNGREKGKQAHMELLLMERDRIARSLFEKHKNELLTPDELQKEHNIQAIHKYVKDYMPPEPELDTMVYYINTGYVKSHGDSQWIKDEKNPEKLKYASSIIDSKTIEEDPNALGYYNVDKYFSAFNKRVAVLLHGFSDEVRDKILAKIKQTRKRENGVTKITKELIKNVFTNNQLELKSYDYDDYDESMYLEPKEVRFWNRYGYDPKSIWDGFKIPDGLELTNDIYDFKLNYIGTMMENAGKKRPKTVNDKLYKDDYVLLKNNKKYSLGFFNGEHLQIVRPNIDNLPKSQHEIEIEEKERLEIELMDKMIESTKNNTETEKIFNERSNKVEYFEKFKKIHNIPMEMKMSEFFIAVPEAKDHFDDYYESMMDLVNDDTFDEDDY